MIYDFDTVIDRRSRNSAKWTWYPPDVLPLWVADMDFLSAEPILNAMRERIDEDVFGYQMDYPPLRDVLVERLAHRHAMTIERDQIVFLPGIVNALNLCARTFAAVGESVLVQPPIYPPFLSAPAYSGKTVTIAPLTETRDGSRLHYTIDFDAFEAAITPETTLFYLCNPHNPTGRAFTRAELEHMAAIALRHNLLIIADEIHCDLVFAPTQHLSIASLSPEVAARTITLIAPSKTFNVAGLACGAAIIPDPDLRKQMMGAAWANGSFVNAMGYIAAHAAYRDGGEWRDQLLVYLQANRDWLSDFVRDELPGAAITLPDSTYMAWMDCGAIALSESEPTAYKVLLERAKVAFNDGTTFGVPGAGYERYVRINFGCPRSTLVEAMTRVRDVLNVTPNR